MKILLMYIAENIALKSHKINNIINIKTLYYD